MWKVKVEKKVEENTKFPVIRFKPKGREEWREVNRNDVGLRKKKKNTFGGGGTQDVLWGPKRNGKGGKAREYFTVDCARSYTRECH